VSNILNLRHSVLPGFRLSFGITLFWLALIVLLPFAALVYSTIGMGWDGFAAAVGSPRVMASIRLSFATAGLSALINLVFGFLVAWVLVRYPFPGKRLVDALVDLPLPTPWPVLR
jgi:sulfate transport system permease protein